MEDLVLIAVLLLIVGLAAAYIVRAKKRGVKCIGCSAGCSCSKGSTSAGNSCKGSCVQGNACCIACSTSEKKEHM